MSEERYRPLVAVAAYHLGPGRVERWPEGGYGVPGTYIDALRRAGARALIVSPGEPLEPEEVLEPFDGLVLVGGGDVDPARYGASVDTEHNYGVDEDRDEFEIGLLRAAATMGVPTLAICRGMQVMNVAFGGELMQHLPDVPGLLEHGVPTEGTETLHAVIPMPGSRLSAATKAGPLTCASHHHQGIYRVGGGIVVTGTSPDGLTESIELGENDPHDIALPWMLGVQWHPEETATSDPAQQSLFDALSLVARLRGVRASPGETEGRSRPFEIVDPDPRWPAMFDAESARICDALGDLVDRIEHVGSTSVAGLGAKPIIDIQVSLRTLAPRAPYVDPLTGLGYEHSLDPWDEEHEYFTRDEGGRRAYQIHVCRTGSTWERRHPAFRDWLRHHPEDAASYEALKRELAAAHPRDILAYTDAKTEFVQRIEALALADAG